MREAKGGRGELALLLIYMMLGAAGLFVHEMWRDEVQAWMLAHDSPSVAALLANLKYEGHPPLWHLLLYALSHVGLPMVSMQIAHYLIAVGAAALLLFRAPFSLRIKACLLFGAPFCFTYIVLARNYAPGWLLAFALAALPRRGERPFTVCLLLVLLANVHFFMAMLSGALCLAFFWGRLDRPHFRAALGLYGLGILGLALQLRPAPDLGVYEQPYLQLDLTHFCGTLQAMTQALLGLDNHPVKAVLAAPFLLAAAGVSVLSFRSTPKICLAWSLLLAGQCACTYALIPATPLHFGTVLVNWLILQWLAQTEGSSPRDRKLASALIAFFALFQVPYGARCLLSDLRHVYSNGKMTARWIQSQPELCDLPILAASDAGTETVSAYLGRPLYYAERRGWGTFVRWDLSRQKLGHVKELAILQDYLDTHPERCLVVLSFSDLEPRFPGRRIRLVASFTQALEPRENQWVYDVSPKVPGLHELWRTGEPPLGSP